jgi:hypothetical protein
MSSSPLIVRFGQPDRLTILGTRQKLPSCTAGIYLATRDDDASKRHRGANTMIRKMLVAAASVAMAATALTAVTTIGSSGTAGAAGKVYASQTCTVTGGMAFASPGLSEFGSLTKKSTSQFTNSVTATGPGCGAGVAASSTVNDKIKSTNIDCVPPFDPQPPSSCGHATVKEHYVDDTVAGLPVAGGSWIDSSLSKGIKVFDNGYKVTADVTADGTSEVGSTGVCGAGDVGFELSGNTSVADLTYTLLLCLAGDTGSGTTGEFYADSLSAADGNSAITIATGTFGGASSLTFVEG